MYHTYGVLMETVESIRATLLLWMNQLLGLENVTWNICLWVRFAKFATLTL